MSRSGDNVSLTTSVKSISVTITGKYQDIKGVQGFNIVNPKVTSPVIGLAFAAHPQKGDKTGQNIMVGNNGGAIATQYKQEEVATLFGATAFTWSSTTKVIDPKTHQSSQKSAWYELGDAVESKKDGSK